MLERNHFWKYLSLFLAAFLIGIYVNDGSRCLPVSGKPFPIYCLPYYLILAGFLLFYSVWFFKKQKNIRGQSISKTIDIFWSMSLFIQSIILLVGLFAIVLFLVILGILSLLMGFVG